MYRPSAAARTARAYMQQAVAAGTEKLAIAGEAMLGALIKLGIYEQAMRENRRVDRANKRANRHTTYHAAGLNGERAVARRLRQIAAGSLRVENGLVAQ